jgi:hypothetical protein
MAIFLNEILNPMLEFHMILFELKQIRPKFETHRSIELMSLSTCNKIVLKIDKRACFTKAVKSLRSLLQGPQGIKPDC